MSFQNDVKRLLSPRSAGGQLALVITVLTILGGLSPTLAVNLAMRTGAVVSDFKFWLVLTHLFIGQLSPFGLLFGIIVALTNGNALEQRWGTRRFWTFVLGVGLTSGLLMVGLGFFISSVNLLTYFSAWALLTWLWVAEGLMVGSGRLSFWGLPITGHIFAAIGVLFPLINAIQGSWVYELETFIGLGLTAAFVYGKTPSGLWTRFRSWQLERDLRKRASHLRSVDGGKRNVGGGSDKYLQ